MCFYAQGRIKWKRFCLAENRWFLDPAVGERGKCSLLSYRMRQDTACKPLKTKSEQNTPVPLYPPWAPASQGGRMSANKSLRS